MQNEAKASRFRGLASPVCIQTVGSLHTPNSGCTGVGPQPLKKKNLLQLGLEGRAIPGLHGDSQEA